MASALLTPKKDEPRSTTVRGRALPNRKWKLCIGRGETLLRLRWPGEIRVDAAPFDEEARADSGLSRMRGTWQGDRGGLRRWAYGPFGEAVVTPVHLGDRISERGRWR